MRDNEDLLLKRLLKVMEDNHWTRGQLAKIAQVAPSAVTAWFVKGIGSRGIKASALAQIAIAGKVDLYWLITGNTYGLKQEQNTLIVQNDAIELRPLIEDVPKFEDYSYISEEDFYASCPNLDDLEELKKQGQIPFIPYISTSFLNQTKTNKNIFKIWKIRGDFPELFIKSGDIGILNTWYRNDYYEKIKCKNINFEEKTLYLFCFWDTDYLLRYATRTLDNKLLVWRDNGYKESIDLNGDKEKTVVCLGKLIGRTGMI